MRVYSLTYLYWWICGACRDGTRQYFRFSLFDGPWYVVNWTVPVDLLFINVTGAAEKQRMAEDTAEKDDLGDSSTVVAEEDYFEDAALGTLNSL